jgi:hypothetical protein
MAKIIYMNGILSGRLGGLVYAFNKAGNYVRTFRSPTQPSTTPQIANRSRFANAVSTWHSMLDANKGAWNVFANTVFKPKFPVSGVAYSGYNAFVSLYNVAANMRDKEGEIAITAPTATPDPALVYEPVFVAPNTGLSGSIKDSSGAPLSFVITSVDVSLGIGTMCKLTFDRIVTVGTATAGPNFSDAIGDEPVGIALVGSLPVTQDVQFINNPEINLLSVCQPIGEITDWQTSPTMEFTTVFAPDMLLRKTQYKDGDRIQVKGYLVGKSGQTMPLNAVMANVTN